MPIMDLTYPQGALDDDARARLADELTTILLRAERAPDSEFFRNVTWLYVHELPAEHVIAAGRPVAAPTFRLLVTTPEGALSDRRRQELVAEATTAIREAAGIPEAEALRVWVLCREIAEGSWGAGGQVVAFQALREAAAAEREKVA
ncbi:tautomerase family protein [Patulibacter defluvii]|uniref:tautomerase family protein n=1 Tax=Patulibacter defluvii TaxID=3095358 RepID=UPI002A750B6D|nr:tautomerase family protein [Patulibacter sp. DM4]